MPIAISASSAGWWRPSPSSTALRRPRSPCSATASALKLKADAAFLVAAGEEGGGRGACRARHWPLGEFEHGDVAAAVGCRRCDFEADEAGADYGDRLGLLEALAQLDCLGAACAARGRRRGRRRGPPGGGCARRSRARGGRRGGRCRRRARRGGARGRSGARAACTSSTSRSRKNEAGRSRICSGSISPRQQGLRQRRPLIRKPGLVADERHIPVVAARAKRGGHLTSALPAADDQHRVGRAATLRAAPAAAAGSARRAPP